MTTEEQIMQTARPESQQSMKVVGWIIVIAVFVVAPIIIGAVLSVLD